MVMGDLSPMSRQMLLDDFVDGLFYELYQQKWRRFAKVQHYVARAGDAAYLALLVHYTVAIKKDPVQVDRTMIPLLVLLFSAVMCAFEVAATMQWVRGRRSSHSSWVAIGRRLVLWMGDLMMYRRLAGICCSATGCILVLSRRDETHQPDGAGDEAVWTCLGVGMLLHMSFFIHMISVPFARLGIFTLVVERILTSDVPTFLTFFSFYLFNFACSMYAVYPRAGSATLSYVAAFNDPISAGKLMLEVGYLQSRFPIEYPMGELQLKRELVDATEPPADCELPAACERLKRELVDATEPSPPLLPPPLLSELGGAQQVNFWIFCAMYLMCLILITILLLRLFMAMLSATFNTTRQAAQLEWRLQFARQVMKAELMHPGMLTGRSTFCGQWIDGKYMYAKTARTTLSPDGLRAGVDTVGVDTTGVDMARRPLPWG